MIPTLLGTLAASLFWLAFVAVIAIEFRNQIRHDQEKQT